MAANLIAHKGCTVLPTVLFLGLGVVVGSACAQVSTDELLAPFLGTTHTEFQAVMQNGFLNGCSINFAALTQDNKVDLGQYLKVEGSIEFFETKERSLGTALKVVVNKLNFVNGQMVSTPSAPTRAYLMADDFSTTLGRVVI